MKKPIALFVFLFVASAPVFGQTTVIRPDYGQFENQGPPTHLVLVRNTSSHEMEIVVRWSTMKTDYHFSVEARKDVKVMLPSYVRLNVRAWAWVYDQKGKKHRKEMRFQWYYDETLGETVFWFPMFK